MGIGVISGEGMPAGGFESGAVRRNIMGVECSEKEPQNNGEQ